MKQIEIKHLAGLAPAADGGMTAIIPDCKTQYERHWWPKVWGVTLLAAADFEFNVGDEQTSRLSADDIIVCEVYTQHGDEISVLMSDAALQSLAEIIAADLNGGAKRDADDAEYERALAGAAAHAADRREAHAASLRGTGALGRA